MDNSGNNRYELLFMDDDGAAPVLPPKVPEVVAGKKKSDDRPARQNINKTEKENKSSVLNKNNAQSKVANNAGPKATGKPAAPNAAVKETRPRQNTRNNHATENNNHSHGPDYNNELPRRQNRDRDIRGPPSRFRNNEKFGKREFDRQSGSDKTGVKPVDKREGGGAHNWGSAKQDIEDQKTGADPTPTTDKDDSGNEQTVGADVANNVEEDESKQMTLDEWKALKDQRAKPNYNLRKAGEGGVENAEWKKMIVLGKKKGGIETEDEFEYDPSMYPQRVGRLQRIVDIQFNFNDGRKTGFRKGGPRGPPRGGPRPEGVASNGFDNNKFASYEKRRSGSKPLKVDDENQFPTLS
ncbi:LOW QUALITY PROTEIN: SERPINE1 mRNA-binding protein 1 [Drosophila sulfurigaster albostrigata]|uniref:LOW QUALITY PROTEIN: SERPINE1 mRNA-binding protein 1 n=1 Tax=Drosophila sulfurigaster albostrigata TaxID=89887 RepID=UPI002D21C738|nr:LOW QUALITY PROTEIN: SERPINE1 mRNA-binding protein 1 [Drosophila sulfurigaster albostrigata]